MKEIDEKNCIILNLLQEDCRMSLTDIAKKIGLSVDSTKKRIEKMKNTVFYPRVQIRPRHFGFKDIFVINIKLHNHTEQNLKEFVDYLMDNQYVAEVFTFSGEWDFSIVVISRDAEHFGEISDLIRNKFSSIIQKWSESLTKFTYKFETYDMLKLMGYK